ncbi:hypothetical protein Hanom_Chr07g00606111 [Helianthus anomalus]
MLSQGYFCLFRHFCDDINGLGGEKLESQQRWIFFSYSVFYFNKRCLKRRECPLFHVEKWMVLRSSMKTARFQTFWIQMWKNKPLDESRKSGLTSRTTMAFYSN